MLRVQDITKRFGPTIALAGVSFEAGRGEVLGLLGDNGAGKTTALRVIAGYLPPTSGRVTVAGRTVGPTATRARAAIGYLPERAPLYDDLRVREWLRFRARLVGLGRRAARIEIARVLDRCGLRTRARARVGTLSRGLRQRLALAGALLGDPPVLVLDEPSAGLDPQQVRTLRALLRELAPEHTIVLSTHVLPEAEAVCNRVLILHRGRVAHEQRIEAGAGDADASGLPLRLEIIAPAEALTAALEALVGVRRIERTDLGGGAHRVRIDPEPGRDLREAVARLALERGWLVRELRPERPSLEELFVRYTTGAAASGPEEATS